MYILSKVKKYSDINDYYTDFHPESFKDITEAIATAQFLQYNVVSIDENGNVANLGIPDKLPTKI